MNNPQNTPAGNNVVIQSSSNAARVTFTEVTTEGTTTFTPIVPPSSAETPPSGYVILGSGPAYDITTTAVYTSPVTVCFNVGFVNNPAEFARVRILHGESGQLIDRTVLAPDSPAPDFATRTVCARTSSLSSFVAALAPAPSACNAGSQGWTATGDSGGTEDESNPANPTYTNQTAAINGGATGAYVLRYSVTALDGLFNSANSFMRLRVRDNGGGANVLVSLRRSNLSAGGIETIATFDSETIGAGSGFQTPADVVFTHTFDFTSYVYWLDLTLNRIDASGLPGFGGAIIGTL